MDNSRSDNSPLDTITVQAVLDHAEEISLIHRALQISEARYRRLFEAVQDGVLLLNAETAQIEDVNPFLVSS